MSKTQKPVLVTTAHRGVFFGYLVDAKNGDIITLSGARNCLYWTTEVRGVLGLAATGPVKGCRVGPAVPRLQLNAVTSVADVTPEACQRWEAAPW